MISQSQSQNSHGLAPLLFTPDILVHIPSTQVTKNSLGERGKVHCVCACMRAWDTRSQYPLGSRTQGPETSTFHSVDRATGEGEGFKQLQGLQCKSQRNTLKSGPFPYTLTQCP